MNIPEKNKPRKDSTQWLIEFTILILMTAIFSGLSYIGQNMLFLRYEDLDRSRIVIAYDLVRACRMICFYVIPTFLFIKRWGGSIEDTGIFFSKSNRLSSVFVGVLVYLIATYVFVKYEIFYDGWQGIDSNWLWIRFILVALMASITDFWTRGFILFELSRKYNDKIAIIIQNITWFTIHIYEIDLLSPYIGVWLAIGLTLFLGFGGDLVALKTRSIVGLMFGHIILNFMILLASNNYI